ncbi:MAG: energy transducer TonB [Steroidobacteraceae bacterium]
MSQAEFTPERFSIDDRLSVTLVLAAVFHLIIVLGVTFSPPRPDPTTEGRTLEVLIVSDSLPESSRNEAAAYAANRTQEGSGEAADDARTRRARSGLPGTTPGPDSPAGAGADSLRRAEQDRLLASAAPAPATASQQDRAQPAAGQTGGRTLLLLGQQDESTLLRGKPRELVIGPSTREARAALYLDGWRRKVERIGTVNFPAEARRRRNSGSPWVEVVITSDGKLASATVKRGSGHAELDRAAVQILNMAAPFEPFPAELAERYDSLRFAYEWQFVGGQLSGSTVTIPAQPR